MSIHWNAQRISIPSTPKNVLTSSGPLTTWSWSWSPKAGWKHVKYSCFRATTNTLHMYIHSNAQNISALSTHEDVFTNPRPLTQGLWRYSPKPGTNHVIYFWFSATTCLHYTTDEQNVHVMPLARPNLGVKAACTAYNVQQRASRPRLSRVW